MTRLWDRGTALDRAVERFTVGRDPDLDQQLLPYDALASAAHATMLARIGVIETTDLEQLLRELSSIVEEARAGSFRIQPGDEDSHTAIENRLTERLGDTGRRVHTGRSRNDQVLGMLRLYLREALLMQCRGVNDIVARLLELAEQHAETPLAGYTHTRQAMPSTVGFLFAAQAECLLDNLPWLQSAFSHADRSPLGSASGYGVALPLDRQLVADLLAFSRVQVNTLAVQNDRGKTEYLVLGVVAATISDLSRLAGDLIWFSSDELGFVRLSPEVTTGSSIMPQKRNPDVLELIRATAARIRSRQAEVGAVYGSLSSGYHRDLQLTKEPLVYALEEGQLALEGMLATLHALSIDEARCRAALVPSIAATDAVYERVAKGEAFRRAYKAVAQDPEAAVSGKPDECWRKRTHLGAPGALELQASKRRLEQSTSWLSDQLHRIQRAWKILAVEA